VSYVQPTSADLPLCSPWTTVDALRGEDATCPPCRAVTDAMDDATIEAAITAASEYLFAVSGFQFTGAECEGYIRPCGGEGQGWWGGLWAWAPIPFVLPDAWPWWGTCGCGGGCDCCGPPAFSMGRFPVVSIDEVKLDGDILVADVDYRLIDGLLVRLDPDGLGNRTWPACQSVQLEDDEPDTMSVTFTYGAAPPALGALAARDLACQLIQDGCVDCQPDTARMTQKTAGGTTLQFISPTGDVATSMPESVKMFLNAYGPRTNSRQFAKMRRPNAHGGFIMAPYPTSIEGYPRWGFGGLGGACVGCS
jgi:hypothetical protein